jgi:hypothetical protein
LVAEKIILNGFNLVTPSLRHLFSVMGTKKKITTLDFAGVDYNKSFQFEGISRLKNIKSEACTELRNYPQILCNSPTMQPVLIDDKHTETINARQCQQGW